MDMEKREHLNEYDLVDKNGKVIDTINAKTEWEAYTIFRNTINIKKHEPFSVLEKSEANDTEKCKASGVRVNALVSDNRRWKSVDEALPEEDGHYEIKVNDEILDDEDAELSPCWYDTEQGWMFDWYSKARYKVTHWRKIKTPE